MLDIETLGKGVGCVILSIAAVPFFKSEQLLGEQLFHMNIDIQSCQDKGLAINADTLIWWMDMPALFKRIQQDTYTLEGALLSLTRFIKTECAEDVRIWGRGPSFDQAILRDAYDRHKQDLPWRYSRERCVRTYLCGYEDLLKKHLAFTGELHHPVHDARHQIRSMHKVQSLTLNSKEDELD